jgi:predicted transcriptional regulator
MQRLSITIEDQLKTELDHIAGKGERAAFREIVKSGVWPI